MCCREALCPIGAELFGEDHALPCPALHEHEDGRGTCGVIESPALWAPVRTRIHGAERMREAAKAVLGAGNGCDGQMYGETVDEEFRLRFLAKDTGYSRRFHQLSVRVWGLDREQP
jgi:hypothetical protein